MQYRFAVFTASRYGTEWGQHGKSTVRRLRTSYFVLFCTIFTVPSAAFMAHDGTSVRYGCGRYGTENGTESVSTTMSKLRRHRTSYFMPFRAVSYRTQCKRRGIYGSRRDQSTVRMRLVRHEYRAERVARHGVQYRRGSYKCSSRRWYAVLCRDHSTTTSSRVFCRAVPCRI